MSIPPVAFLGVVERHAYVRDGNTPLWKYNILGLKPIVATHIFPLSLSQFGLAFALYPPLAGAEINLKVVADGGGTVGSLQIALSGLTRQEGEQTAAVSTKAGAPVFLTPPMGWTFAVLRADVLVHTPGLYSIVVDDGTDAVAGQVFFALVEPPPLTADRVAAIRSDPAAAKAVRARIACSTCGEGIRTYAGLERSADAEVEGWLWHDNLPDSFQCSCGRLTADLTILRRNLHGLLGQPIHPGGEVAQVPLYERGAVANVYQNFSSLLMAKSPEETFQKFIEENPIVLHAFSPERIFFKAPILSLHKTDFAIVNHQRELVLVELERPDSRLLKKDGGVHSELQHAFDQARDWLHATDEHRGAVLDCIGVTRSEVGAVRAIVVAGTDRACDTEDIRKLKGTDFGRIRLLTYDDLLAGLGVLLLTIEKL